MQVQLVNQHIVKAVICYYTYKQRYYIGYTRGMKFEILDYTGLPPTHLFS